MIDLDPETVSLLKQHRARQRELFLMVGVTATASDRVFTNEVGDPIRPTSIGQAFRRLVEAAGVPVIRLHDLRHTHASHLLMAGVNVKVVSERLGHASVSFTLDTYGHVMPGQQAEAAARSGRAPGRDPRIAGRPTVVTGASCTSMGSIQGEGAPTDASVGLIRRGPDDSSLHLREDLTRPVDSQQAVRSCWTASRCCRDLGIRCRPDDVASDVRARDLVRQASDVSVDRISARPAS